MTHLVGVDMSRQMIAHTRERAEEQYLSNRVESHVMDALRLLEFPLASFDLVNLWFGISFLRTWVLAEIAQ